MMKPLVKLEALFWVECQPTATPVKSEKNSALRTVKSSCGEKFQNRHRIFNKIKFLLRHDQLPLKIATRSSEVEARDLNSVEESSAECVSDFRV